MCAPVPVLGLATLVMNRLAAVRGQRDSTPQIARNEVPPARLPIPGASGSLDPERIKGEDEDITVASTTKQKKDRKRVREGLKTLSAVDPTSTSLPTAPDQGIST